MRWDDLFEDMEAQLAAQRYRDIEIEAADLTRAEYSVALLEDRCAAHIGARLRMRLTGALYIDGPVLSVGSGWVVVDDAGTQTLALLGAVDWIEGLTLRRQSPEKRRNLGVGHALRALAMARAVVRVHLRSGPTAVIEGTVDRAGGDHFDVALHPHDEFRRQRSVQSVRAIPYSAISCVLAQGAQQNRWSESG